MWEQNMWDSLVCVKCGSTGFSRPYYRGYHHTEYGAAIPEALIYACKTCAFEMSTPTLDRQREIDAKARNDAKEVVEKFITGKLGQELDIP
jgi:hypothetical protein